MALPLFKVLFDKGIINVTLKPSIFLTFIGHSDFDFNSVQSDFYRSQQYCKLILILSYLLWTIRNLKDITL